MAEPQTGSRQSLPRLSESGYEVAPNEPDVRGWDVVLADREKIGKVDDLIIDPAAGRVRYLEVDLDRKAIGLDRERHVLVPIDTTRLDRKEEEVLLSGMRRDALLTLPEYNLETFSPAYDDTFRSHIGQDSGAQRITESAEELRIGKRVEQQGEVRVNKRIETEHVRQEVPLQREEVHVERRPVQPGQQARADFREEEVVIPVMGEEAVVEKRPVVKEEVVIRKEVKTDRDTVDADVRREKVDVDATSKDVRLKDDGKRRGGR